MTNKLLEFLSKFNPIRVLTDYNRKHPIIGQGDVIHLCFEQYGQIKPYFIKDIVVRKTYVENYDMKVPDYIRLIPVTEENLEEIRELRTKR